MKVMSKETALKAALLMVLAANMSWERVEFSSTNLASQSEAVKSAGAAASAPAAKASDAGAGGRGATPVALALVAKGDKPEAVKAETTAVDAARVTGERQKAADLAAAATKTKPQITERQFQACGKEFTMVLTETDAHGQTLTQVQIRDTKEDQGKWMLKAKNYAGKLVDNLEESKLADIKTKAQNAVAAYHVEKAIDCPQETKKAKNDAKPETTEKKKRKAARLENCTHDQGGTRLDKTEQMACFVEKISKLADKEFKTDDDEKVKRSVMADLRKIVRGPLHKLLKEHLLSKDESEQSAGITAIEEAISAVLEVGDAFDLGQSRNKLGMVSYNNDISKIVKELESMKLGAETTNQARAYKDRATDLRDGRREAYFDLQRDITNPMKQATLQSYDQAYFNLSNEINGMVGNAFMRPLTFAQTTGALSSADFKDFSAAFRDLQSLMEQARDPKMAITATSRMAGPVKTSILGEDIAIPTDLSAVRTQKINDTLRLTGSLTGGSGGIISYEAPKLNFGRPTSTFQGAAPALR